MATYLEFEKPIEELEEGIHSASIKGDMYAVETLKKKLSLQTEKVYTNLTDYQKLQLARHPDRPYALDYIKQIMTKGYEIHGDRHFRDDPSIVCYLGFIGGQKAVIIGQEKGRGTKIKLKRNFGMPHPEGYRKALRAIELAEKFNIPVLMLIDTPGAYPGLGAEERNQSEAIAKNLFEFSSTKAITISVVIGEGGSGGALAMGVADKLVMMQYSVFSVISPEGCSAILWKDNTKVETATQALKITALNLKEYGLIDDIIQEPISGAHRHKEEAAKNIKDYFLDTVKTLQTQPTEQRLQNRYDKILKYGSFTTA